MSIQLCLSNPTELSFANSIPSNREEMTVLIVSRVCDADMLPHIIQARGSEIVRSSIAEVFSHQFYLLSEVLAIREVP